MVESGKEDLMTTKELADTLGVDVKTIQRLATSLDINVERTGKNHGMTFNRAQATVIKMELQNHSKVARNGFTTTEISNDLEMMVLQRKLSEYQTRRIEELLQENQQQKQQLAEQKPKVEFYDTVTESDTTSDLGTVAKVLNVKGMGRNNLFKFLKDKKVLMADNRPYQEFVDRGYFKVVEEKYQLPSGENKVNFKTVVYQKGVDYIRKLVAG